MTRLLVVHHTVSPALAELVDVVVTSAKNASIDLDLELEISTRPALTASAVDVLAADAIFLGTPVNIGYMSGALKHFFDQIYYPCLNETVGLPYGYYLHGNDDATGARRAIDKITGALQWKSVGPPVEVTGGVSSPTREALADLVGRVLAAAI